MIQPAAQLGGEVGVDTWVKFGSRFAFGDAKRDGLSGSRSQEWERVKLYSGPGKTRRDALLCQTASDQRERSRLSALDGATPDQAYFNVLPLWLGSPTLADAPLIEAEMLFRQPEPPRAPKNPL